MAYEIVRLADCPGLEGQASLWFHEKWGIPLYGTGRRRIRAAPNVRSQKLIFCGFIADPAHDSTDFGHTGPDKNG